jgi:hypothetical protein
MGVIALAHAVAFPFIGATIAFATYGHILTAVWATRHGLASSCCTRWTCSSSLRSC